MTEKENGWMLRYLATIIVLFISLSGVVGYTSASIVIDTFGKTPSPAKPSLRTPFEVQPLSLHSSYEGDSFFGSNPAYMQNSLLSPSSGSLKIIGVNAPSTVIGGENFTVKVEVSYSFDKETWFYVCVGYAYTCPGERVIGTGTKTLTLIGGAPQWVPIPSLHLEASAYVYDDVERKSIEADRQSFVILSSVLMTGTQKIIVIPVRYVDVKNTSSLERVVSNIKEMEPYYKEVSYGKITIQLSYLSNWFDLPRTMTYYWEGNREGLGKWDELVIDSLKVADPYVDFRDYNHVMIVYPCDEEVKKKFSIPSGMATQGIPTWPTDDGIVEIGFATVCGQVGNYVSGMGLYAHEFGHNLGLPDLYDIKGNETFVGIWSLMSYAGNIHLMAVEKMWLGWISPDQIVNVSDGQIMNVTLSDIATGGGILAVKIPMGSNYYTVESRRKTLFDRGLPMDGVLISYVNESRSGGGGIVKVVDSTPGTPGSAQPYYDELDDAVFTKGQRYIDRSNEVAIRVLSTGSSLVQVQKGFSDLSVEGIATVGSLFDGESVLFMVTVKNSGVTATNYGVAELQIDGVLEQTQSIPRIHPGSSSKLVFGPWTVKSGYHTIKILLDRDDDIVERNETNNFLIQSINAGIRITVDKAVVSDSRADVNSSQTISFHAVSAQNGGLIDLTNGIIYVNGTAYPVNATGWIELKVTSRYVAKQIWTVTKVEVEGRMLGHQQTAPDPTIIWDNILITLSVHDNRVDVGSNASISYTAFHAFDSQLFQGRIILNDYIFTQDSAGQRFYTTARIVDTKYGLTAFTSNNVSIIFDKIKVVLSPSKPRSSVGQEAGIQYSAHYVFDGTPFAGSLSLSNNTIQTSVGKYAYSVTSIVDKKYELTTFESNKIDIIFDRAQILLSAKDDRIDVGSNASITYTAIYEYDKTPFRGQVKLNDRTVKSEVGRYLYKASSITDPTYGLTVFSSNDLYVIFDSVSIMLRVGDDRIDVGSNASITYTAIYEYDRTPYKGHIELNDTTTKYTVGKYLYTVSTITDSSYGLNAYTGNKVHVVFDSVSIKIEVEKRRIDLGKNVSLKVRGVYDYDKAPFDGLITLNNTVYRYDTVGKRGYTAAKLSGDSYGITVISKNDSDYVIFDRVSILLSVDDKRIDVGSNATFLWEGRYEYDNSHYRGSINLNDTTVKLKVGRYRYMVNGISDSLYNLTAFSSNAIDIVFDRVIVTLSPTASRVDVGSNASINYSAFYEYDAQPYRGSILLSDTLMKTAIGQYRFQVQSISDPLYGIKSFSTNIISVIYDRVSIDLIVEQSRVGVERNVTITWMGLYKYDNLPFAGTLTLNDTTMKLSLGRYHYTVEKIVDTRFGLIAFTSNVVDVVFDRIKVERGVETLIPGKVDVLLKLQYEYDGENVEDAIVTVNEVKGRHMGSGVYGASLSNWSPLFPVTTRVEKIGFMTLQEEATSYAIGNIIIIIISALAVIAVPLTTARKRRSKKGTRL